MLVYNRETTVQKVEYFPHGRALIDWAQKLCNDHHFIDEILHNSNMTQVIDRMYGRNDSFR